MEKNNFQGWNGYGPLNNKIGKKVALQVTNYLSSPFTNFLKNATCMTDK